MNQFFNRYLARLSCLLLSVFMGFPANAASSFPEQKRTWDPAPLFAEVVRSAALPRLARSETAARQFAAGVNQFCAAPSDPARLNRLRQDWRAAILAWAHSAAFASGPAEEPLGRSRGQQIAYWPAAGRRIDEMLGGLPVADLNAALLLGVAVDRKGLYAAEYLLFPASDEAFVGPPGERRCAYLQALSQDLVAQVSAVNSAWRGSYWADRLADMGSGADYHGVYFAVDELVRYSVQLLEIVKLDHLEPLASSSPAARVQRVPGWRGGVALALPQAMLDSLRSLLLAGHHDSQRQSYLQLAETAPACPRCRGIIGAFQRQLDRISSGMAQLVDAGAEAALAKPEPLHMLDGEISTLELLIKRRLAMALQTPAGFNSRDGD